MIHDFDPRPRLDLDLRSTTPTRPRPRPIENWSLSGLFLLGGGGVLLDADVFTFFSLGHVLKINLHNKAIYMLHLVILRIDLYCFIFSPVRLIR